MVPEFSQVNLVAWRDRTGSLQIDVGASVLDPKRTIDVIVVQPSELADGRSLIAMLTLVDLPTPKDARTSYATPQRFWTGSLSLQPPYEYVVLIFGAQHQIVTVATVKERT